MERRNEENRRESRELNERKRKDRGAERGEVGIWFSFTVRVQ
jgi:hypothetical protein